jgi:hypothetical protein
VTAALARYSAPQVRSPICKRICKPDGVNGMRQGRRRQPGASCSAASVEVAAPARDCPGWQMKCRAAPLLARAIANARALSRADYAVFSAAGSWM